MLFFNAGYKIELKIRMHIIGIIITTSFFTVFERIPTLSKTGYHGNKATSILNDFNQSIL